MFESEKVARAAYSAKIRNRMNAAVAFYDEESNV
jgi:hypothetical protein